MPYPLGISRKECWKFSTSRTPCHCTPENLKKRVLKVGGAIFGAGYLTRISRKECWKYHLLWMNFQYEAGESQEKSVERTYNHHK